MFIMEFFWRKVEVLQVFSPVMVLCSDEIASGALLLKLLNNQFKQLFLNNRWFSELWENGCS